MHKVWLKVAPGARLLGAPLLERAHSAAGRRPPEGPPAPPAPEAARTVGQMLQSAARQWRQRPALSCLGHSVSHGQLDAWSLAFAAWLQGQGLQHGDRVALLLPNLPQLPVLLSAVWRAGLVAVPVDPHCPARELEHRLKDCGARAVVLVDHAAAVLEQVLPPGHGRKLVVTAPGDLLGPVKGPLVNHLVRRMRRLAPARLLPGAVRFADALAAGRKLPFVPPAVQPEDIALLQYTGGTTAPSRAAVLLHRQVLANLQQCQAWFDPVLRGLPAEEPLVTLCALPLHHVFGLGLALLFTLRLGGCCVLVPDAQDSAAVLKELARQRVHLIPGTDPLFAALAAHPEASRVDWSALRLALAGAMAVRPATAAAWQACTGVPLCEGYGLTETSPAVSCNPVQLTQWTGGIGLPLPGTELRLLDDLGDEVPPGTPGEIAIRGPQVMAGYWQRPDETARVMTADGFFRSGDIGVLDERGHLRLVDRKKDTILVSGFDVYPNEVEGVVTQLPGVLECAAVGMPDARVGETVKLLVVKADPDSASPSEAEVHAHCAAHLSGYKRPRVVEFRAHLPKTSVGKVMRRALREHG